MILAAKRTQKQAAKPEASEFYSRSFLDYLRGRSAFYAELCSEHQHALAANLWAAAVGARYAHKEHADAYTLHWRSRQKMYGSAQMFHALNMQLDWFELVEGAKPSQHIAQAWRLTPNARGAVNQYFTLAGVARAKDAAGLIDQHGNSHRMPADGIRSRTHDGGNTKHPRHAMRSAVDVNGDALHHFHLAGEAWLLGDPAPAGFEWVHAFWDGIRGDRGPNGGEEKARERANRALVQASALLHMAKSSSLSGYVLPMVYQEYPTGRLFAEGALNLQNCQKEVRRAALMGSWDVDVSNCHWSLLQQMAARLELATPAIDNYLANKRPMRRQIALAGGVSESDAKQVLLGLVYGMNLQATEASRKQAIIETVGAEAAARLRVFEPLLELYREVQRLRGAIIADYEQRTTRKQCLVNDAGNAIALTAPPAEKLAHILQGAEAAILRAVIQEHGPVLKLLAHDGWVMAVEPSRIGLEAMIRERTGYQIELEISPL